MRHNHLPPRFTIPCEGCIKEEKGCPRQWHYAVSGDIYVCDHRLPALPPFTLPLPFIWLYLATGVDITKELKKGDLNHRSLDPRLRHNARERRELRRKYADHPITKAPPEQLFRKNNGDC